MNRGTRVELSPACDLWMRGARFGTISRTKTRDDGTVLYGVRMDHPQVRRLQYFTADYLTAPT